jgi:Xaa-Pro aminopeptidase
MPAHALLPLLCMVLQEATRPQAPEVPQNPTVPASEFRARREALAKELGDGILVLAAAPAIDNQRYLQGNNFWYLTGVDVGGTALLLEFEHGKLTTDRIYLPARQRMQEAWNGSRPAPGPESEKRLGFASSAAFGALAREVDAALGKHQVLYTDVERPPRPRGGGESRPAGAATPRDAAIAGVVRKQEKAVSVRGYGEAIGRLRVIKSPAEQDLLRRSIQITCLAMLEGWKELRPGGFEYELEAAVEAGFRRRGAMALGFPTIIGSGPNSCILHYDLNQRQTQAGELVVMDIGAKYGFYVADVTRTVPVSGRFSARQREIYQIVLAAQKAGIAAIKPGVPFRAVDQASRAVIQDKGYEKYFNHGTSHQLGLDVHDPGSSGRLEAGMVITVEPGIYIAEESLGVRIEDDFLVTAEGCEHLSRFVPREIEEIEALLQARAGAAR